MSADERFKGANVVEAGTLSPYWGEHAARYRFALPFIKDQRVLDIACGTGYGLGIMAKSANFVIGADIDQSAVLQAAKECSESAAVTISSGTHLPFSHAAFDVVTSFETLEHLRARGEFLSELRRVLRPGGTLVLSTPNAKYTMPINGKPVNPFHVHEYEPDELVSELSPRFHVKRFVGQRLDPRFRIPPFQDAQKRLPKDTFTQASLFGWRVMNKIPVALREPLSRVVWREPFYPTERDYVFDEESVATAPVLVAVCEKPTE